MTAVVTHAFVLARKYVKSQQRSQVGNLYIAQISINLITSFYSSFRRFAFSSSSNSAWNRR